MVRLWKTFQKVNIVRYIVLYNLYKDYIKNGGKKEDFKTKKIVINTPFVQEQSSNQREDMLHTMDGPMQLIHTDVADLNFFSKSTVVPKYCLVCVDVFTSKTYTYDMKKKNQLARKNFIRNPRAQEIFNQRREGGTTPSNQSRI